MANTLYTEVYTVFQSQINDVELNSLVALEDLQKQYLINSIPKFRRCLQDLNNRTDSTSTFNIALIEDVIQILGNLMVVEYMSSQIVNLSLIKQSMKSRDFDLNSQASHLEKLLLLRKDRNKEISKMIVDYTYSFSDLTTLK